MIVDLGTVPCDTADSGGALIYLSRAGGITQFGAYLDRLMPGAVSGQRHWHSAEDEFALVLSGHATLIDDAGAHTLAPGDACCWRHGEPNGHHIRNQGDQPFRYLIVGSRAAGDICSYPDAGQRQVNAATEWWIEDRTGHRLKGGTLPPHLLNLAPSWGRSFDGASLPRLIKAGTVAAITGTNYPRPLDDHSGYQAIPLSDHGGLTQFGAFTEVLAPGAWSSQRHWHAAEDEFLYMLSGEVALVENDGAQILRPGDVVCWPKGQANGHHLINRTSQPATYFIVGTRADNDECHYPDVDLLYWRRDGLRAMTHKDGTPYPGWPKETNR